MEPLFLIMFLLAIFSNNSKTRKRSGLSNCVGRFPWPSKEQQRLFTSLKPGDVIRIK